jgi:hypothetical protein
LKIAVDQCAGSFGTTSLQDLVEAARTKGMRPSYIENQVPTESVEKIKPSVPFLVRYFGDACDELVDFIDDEHKRFEPTRQ